MSYNFNREMRERCIKVYEKHYDVVLTHEEADEILTDLANLSLFLFSEGEIICDD